VLREDARGARLAKERRDSPRRIDAAVAAVMAHDRATALAGVTRDSIYIGPCLRPRGAHPGVSWRGSHRAIDLPRNADDAAGITGAQTNTPAAVGPVGRGDCAMALRIHAQH